MSGTTDPRVSPPNSTRDPTAVEGSLEEQLQIANGVARIATSLARGVDLDAALAEAGRLVEADRSYVFQFRDGTRLMDDTHEWCAPGVTPQIQRLQGLSTTEFAWFVDQVKRGEAFEIRDVGRLPDEARAERALLGAQGIKSLLIMPFGPDREPIGYVGLDNVRDTGEWHSVDVELLRIVAELIGDALERDRGRQALETSLQQQLAILENIPDIAWLKDAEGRFIHVNQPFARSCGLQAPELVGKTDADVWPQALARRYRRDDAEVMRTRTSKRVEEPLVLRELGERTIETVKAPVLDNNGNVVGTTGIARDITERKRAERTLRESEERYRRLVESLPAIVYRHVPDTGAHYWSPQVEDILGYSPQSLEQDPLLWHDAIHATDLVRVDQAMAAFEVGSRIDLIYRIRDTSGNWHWFQDRCIGRLGVDGSLVVEGITFDLTERKRAEEALRQSEAKYRLIVEHQTDIVVKVDLQGRFMFVSRSYCETFGRHEEELIGEPFAPLVDTRTGAVSDEAMVGLRQPPHEYRLERRMLTSNGWCWFAWANKAMLDEEGCITAIVSVGRDVSERRAAEEALEHEKEKAHITLHSIGDAVITTDASGHVEYLNPIAEELTGWRSTEAAGRPVGEVFRVIDEESGQPAEDSVSRCLRESRTIELPKHSILISRRGDERAIEDSAAPIRDADGHTLGAVLVFKDTTERRRLDQQIAHAATHDSLTGLVNRAEFEQRLDHALAGFLQHGKPSVLCYLDLDQFKVVNDAAGHRAGDEMLKQVAALLATRVRSRDTLARLGGDEFGLLLEDCSLHNAVTIAGDVISTLADFRLTWGQRRFAVGVSIGVVPFTVDGAEQSVLTSRADMACFAAKDMGRNRVYVYHAKDAELMQRHRDIVRAAELRDAMEQDRIVLYAQPITRVEDPLGRPWRYEVLARLQTDDGELLQPGAFIPAAERYGLISELDCWIISKALREYAKLSERCDCPGIAINISGSSLNNEHLPDYVRSELRASGVPPSRICFEVTETAAINRLSQAKRFIEELRSLECSFALDDFGSGLSSFNYLKHLPVDYLKVDGGFVRDMPDDPVDEAMVRAITQIGHVMGIKTVAEQVETAAVTQAAINGGVDFLQGFAIGKPVPLSSVCKS